MELILRFIVENGYLLISHLVALSIGYSVGQYDDINRDLLNDKFIRNLIALVVVGVWSYKFYISTTQPGVDLTLAENIIMGIVMGYFYDADGTFISTLANNLLENSNGKDK